MLPTRATSFASVSLIAATLCCGCADSPEAATTDVAAQTAPLQAASYGGRCERVSLEVLGSYRSGVFDEGAAEIVDFDPATSRLFVVNADAAKVEVLDARDPTAPTRIGELDFTSYGGGATSVAVSRGLLAVAVPAEERTDPGHVVFVETASLEVLNSVEVGALPDMVTFTPNGRYVLAANEGEPSTDYLTDPEGSISVIDLTRGVRRLDASRVRTADFAAFDRDSLDASIRIFGPNASVAQDLEPEYITVSDDSRTAWVTLQENNAIAKVDIRTGTVSELIGLGYKDHSRSGQGLDPSDEDAAIAIAPWPVRGLYLPDAIQSYRSGGRTYLVTANEGDTRDYDGFAEETRIADLALDPEAFPDAAALQDPAALGRLKVTNTLGDDDADGDYDALYTFGARSFSIRDSNGTLVFDSGDQLERITARMHPDFFNADNTESELDARSDDKGPEPEGVELGELNRRTYAFIALERISSIVAYDITNPRAPCLAGYASNRIFEGDPELDEGGDLAPEGLHFISAAQSPTGEPLLAVANEVSGSTTLYRVGGNFAY
jgi:2',3'-cyclic-nucleotide 2'-phosphodiesterase/3'-nucleotidase/5'-nucleotidase